MEFLSLYSLPPLISSILFLLIGLGVYKNNPRKALNISFLCLCITTFIWQFVMFLIFNTKNPELASIMVRVAHIGIVFLPVLVYQFALNLAGSIKRFDQFFLFVNYVAALLFELLLFTDYLIAGYYTYFWSYYPRAGILHPVYLVFLTVVALRVVYILVKSLPRKKDQSIDAYQQIKFVLWAIVFYIYASTDFLLNYGVEFYPFGFLFVLIFLGITSYSIVRHHLMDIKVALRQSSVYILSFLLIAILAVVFNIINNPQSQFYVFFNIIEVLFLAALFPFVKSNFHKIANKYFFTSLYDSKEVIQALSSNLRSTLDLNYIYEALGQSINSTFHVKSFGFAVFDSDNNHYKLKFRSGELKNVPDTFEGNFSFHQSITKQNKVVQLDSFSENNDLIPAEVVSSFNEIGISVLVPVNVKWRNIGLLVLGEKESRDNFSREDMSLLELMAGLGATAIENGFLYKNINEKNKDLEELLKVKTDFLRIANHQLNTPLSIMRLAYSSVDEKSISIDEGFKMAREGLNRLSEVVSQLWTVFEIDGGEIKLEEENVDLKKLFLAVIKDKENSNLVKERGLKISMKINGNLGFFESQVSKRRIGEVFSSLLDNACFYTKNGSVTVVLEKTRGNKGLMLKTCIKDTGTGIKEEDKGMIFEKFSRGKDAALLHPDGSGVSLFVARHIIEASGGKLWLEKTLVNQGSTFCFTLPIYEM